MIYNNIILRYTHIHYTTPNENVRAGLKFVLRNQRVTIGARFRRWLLRTLVEYNIRNIIYCYYIIHDIPNISTDNYSTDSLCMACVWGW